MGELWYDKKHMNILSRRTERKDSEGDEILSGSVRGDYHADIPKGVPRLFPAHGQIFYTFFVSAHEERI